MAKLDKHTIDTQIILLEGLKTRRPPIYNDAEFALYVEGINTSIDVLKMLLSNNNNNLITSIFNEGKKVIKK
jgi:hypothetical protein